MMAKETDARADQMWTAEGTPTVTREMNVRLRICRRCAQRMPSTAPVEYDGLERRLVEDGVW